MHGVVAHVGAIVRARGLGLRVTDGADADVARGREVLVEVRRRYLENVRDVVEAVAREVGRQHRARVDLHAEQIADRGRVLRAIQPMHGLAARRGTALGGGLVEIALERRDELVDLFCVRPRLARRRHQVSAELANHLLPELGLGRDVADLHVLERALARELGVVVAIRAVALEDVPVRRDRLLGRALARAASEREAERDADRSQLREPRAPAPVPTRELVSRPAHHKPSYTFLINSAPSVP